MNSKSLRRLAADHGSLHTAGLPPNYLFAPGSDGPEDLTSLDILLAGPVGTPYAGGVWRLHLDIPPTYPTAPPTAQFRTRLWHPNIDEATGAVCVETLKRDWTSTLKLRDVLVTISCLLIQPNPASALNEAAGKLAVEDWDGYCRRAQLMTEIHAAIPSSLAKDVREAQMRGEEPTTEPEQPVARPRSKAKVQRQPSEDEENRRRRGMTQDADSDPESDWIPGPVGTTKTAARQESNIFGIKGLDDAMQLDTPPRRIFATETKSAGPLELQRVDDSDPFTAGPSRHSKAQAATPFDLRVPPVPTTASTETRGLRATSALSIQHTTHSHPLVTEFSFSWDQSNALYNPGLAHDAANHGASKADDVKKRLTSVEFETKRKWEMKRLRRAGSDIRRYNRGDFGPRMGVGRL
ncbi:uncharacterized protein SETTUDRAFT_156718 [Exserohilum turcica Et28A]|uniref:UBC core domain-containing protein n=1 Tax=Exserohilum turcicum (strain 28A) TaxID=671987 RepID=R0JKI6_EXST2|nr:uncharacterized protein SETTUDRAFT_156718 [Exserohilum turcica Et28A]EOA81813.1 hypothetical protein SETTUDRAFT_156718 [Exserohilum turcica Et28A]